MAESKAHVRTRELLLGTGCADTGRATLRDERLECSLSTDRELRMLQGH